MNPYLPLWEHLPDGEARVFEDPDNPKKYRAYIIGSHDVRLDSYCGNDIRIWSCPVEDLSAWRDEGPVFTYQAPDKTWDIMYAPDLVEVKRRDGTKTYFLYPHSRGPGREAMVCSGPTPVGPFKPINLTPDGKDVLPGSFIGFDPAVYVEQIDDPKDPDYEIGFRAYVFFGFQNSNAAQLDQNTMWSVRPGTEIIRHFIPSSHRYGVIKDPEGTKYPHVYEGEDLTRFNYFEAKGIRKVENKYALVFSGYSGPDYGLDSTNSTLRYAYADSPLGPWKIGGVLVDSRAPVLNENGTALETSFSAHNTHGGLQQIGDMWYVFYHRPPRGFGYARQAVVAPVKIECDTKSVADGGKLVIRAYDPYAENEIWTAKASNGDEYTGAQVTSEGFYFYGLPPYKYYSAGFASYLSDTQSMQDNWDIWDNHQPVTDVKADDRIGFLHFGFGGLKDAKHGILPFEGTAKGNNTQFNVWLAPKTDSAFSVSVWLDGPWDNDTWKGKKIGKIEVPANSKQETTRYTINVSEFVENLDKKHAVFLVAESDASFDLIGIGFSSDKIKIERPVPPRVNIKVNGKEIELPEYPVRSTVENGIMGYDIYEASVKLPKDSGTPEITASSDNNSVGISISGSEVKFDYKGAVKTYRIKFDII